MSIQGKDILIGCKRRPLLCACILLGVALLAAFYFRKDMIGETETILAERSKLLRKLKSNVANAAQIEQQVGKLTEINDSFIEGALSVGELASNQQIFLRLESETGIKLIDLQPQALPKTTPTAANPKAGSKAAVSASTYSILRYALTISGDYGQLVGFLKRLERAPALNRLVGASISSSDLGSDIHLMTITVELLGRRK